MKNLLLVTASATAFIIAIATIETAPLITLIMALIECPILKHLNK